MFLKLQRYWLRSLAKYSNEKLSQRFYKFEIVERLGNVAYKLNLSPYTRLHLVFHISQLKKAIDLTIEAQSLPIYLTKDMELMLQPEKLLEVRWNSTGLLEVLIQWKDLPTWESTWEQFLIITMQFLAFHLEDKLNLIGEGIVKPPIKQVHKKEKQGSQ